jgi:hypothetical protein
MSHLPNPNPVRPGPGPEQRLRNLQRRFHAVSARHDRAIKLRRVIRQRPQPLPLRLPLRSFGAWVRALGRSRQRSDISRQPPTVILPAWSAWHPRDGGARLLEAPRSRRGWSCLRTMAATAGSFAAIFAYNSDGQLRLSAGLETSCGCMEVRCRHCNPN